MKQLIKGCMALVLPVIAMMTLLVPMASAHAESLDHYSSSTQKLLSRTYSRTVHGTVSSSPILYAKTAYCDSGDYVTNASHWSLVGTWQFISFLPIQKGNQQGAQLTFGAFTHTSYQVTAVCSTRSLSKNESLSQTLRQIGQVKQVGRQHGSGYGQGWLLTQSALKNGKLKAS